MTLEHNNIIKLRRDSNILAYRILYESYNNISLSAAEQQRKERKKRKIAIYTLIYWLLHMRWIQTAQ